MLILHIRLLMPVSPREQSSRFSMNCLTSVGVRDGGNEVSLYS